MGQPDLKTIADALGEARPKSGGGYLALCPGHDDKNGSLSLDHGEKGLLYFCLAGCSQEVVRDALKDRGLLPGKGKANPVPPKRSAPTKQIWTPILPVPASAPAPPVKHPRHGAPALRWDYRDAAGGLSQIVYRFNSADGGKFILPLTFCSDGTTSRWCWQALPAPRPLYSLNLLAANVTLPVLIVEGEKTADAARLLLCNDYAVTTWPNGAAAIGKTDFSPLRGRSCILWPDADEPGQKAMQQVASQLQAIGAASVRIVELPEGLPKGWDLADAEFER